MSVTNPFSKSPRPPEMDPEDSAYLQEREKIVEKGLQGPLLIGKALIEIRDYKGGVLFKKKYVTIEGYCRERFDIGKSHAYRLINVAEVMAELETHFSPNGGKMAVRLPTSERQVRPLTVLKTAEDRIKAWALVLDKAKDKKITGALVEGMVREILKGSGKAETVRDKPLLQNVEAADDPAIDPEPDEMEDDNDQEIPSGSLEDTLERITDYLDEEIPEDRRDRLAEVINQLVKKAVEIGLSIEVVSSAPIEESEESKETEFGKFVSSGIPTGRPLVFKDDFGREIHLDGRKPEVELSNN